MKNFFGNKFEKGNPFVDGSENKGDETETMTEEIKEQENEIVEETTEETPVEEVQQEEVVESESDKLKADFENLNNQYLRLAADFDNFRKRQEQEREALLKYGKQECMKKIIEVVDNFDRAVQSV